MEIKQAIVFVVKKGEYTFQFIVESGSTWGSAIDAAYEVLQQVGKMSQENADKMKPVEQIEE